VGEGAKRTVTDMAAPPQPTRRVARAAPPPLRGEREDRAQDLAAVANASCKKQGFNRCILATYRMLGRSAGMGGRGVRNEIQARRRIYRRKTAGRRRRGGGPGAPACGRTQVRAPLYRRKTGGGRRRACRCGTGAGSRSGGRVGAWHPLDAPPRTSRFL